MNTPIANNKTIGVYEQSDLEELNENLQIDNIAAEQLVERKNRIYGFNFNDEKLFFEDALKREFFEKITIKEIPLMPDSVLGLCNVRGNLIPVYDLSIKYGFEVKVEHARDRKVLVISDGANMIGFAMDEMLLPIDYFDDELIEVETEVQESISALVNKSFLINNQTWHQIDHECLFESLLCV